jgi:dihydrofolate reductase
MAATPTIRAARVRSWTHLDDVILIDLPATKTDNGGDDECDIIIKPGALLTALGGSQENGDSLDWSQISPTLAAFSLDTSTAPRGTFAHAKSRNQERPFIVVKSNAETGSTINVEHVDVADLRTVMQRDANARQQFASMITGMGGGVIYMS